MSAFVSRQRANGAINKDARNHEENASQRRQPCIPLGDLLTGGLYKVVMVRRSLDMVGFEIG